MCNQNDVDVEEMDGVAEQYAISKRLCVLNQTGDASHTKRIDVRKKMSERNHLKVNESSRNRQSRLMLDNNPMSLEENKLKNSKAQLLIQSTEEQKIKCWLGKIEHKREIWLTAIEAKALFDRGLRSTSIHKALGVGNKYSFEAMVSKFESGWDPNVS